MISGIHLKGIAQEMLKTNILDVIAEKKLFDVKPHLLGAREINIACAYVVFSQGPEKSDRSPMTGVHGQVLCCRWHVHVIPNQKLTQIRTISNYSWIRVHIRPGPSCLTVHPAPGAVSRIWWVLQAGRMVFVLKGFTGYSFRFGLQMCVLDLELQMCALEKCCRTFHMI